MNGLAHITIAGQQVGLKFGMPALRRIVEKMQQFDLLEGDTSNDLGVVHILFAGYLNYCAMHDTASVLAFDAFYNYVETAPDNPDTVSELRSAVREFEESRYVKAVLDNHKKKAQIGHLTGTTSSLSALESSDTHR